MKVIKHATIFTPGVEKFLGHIILKDGIIQDIIQEKEADFSTYEIIDVHGALVTPGFIDCHTHLGIEEEVHSEGEDTNEMTNPLTPELKALDGVNLFDCAFDDALKAGVTTVMATMGSANVIGGITCILKTGGSIEKRVVNDYAGLKMAFGENPKRVYGEKQKEPQTRMKTMALARQAFYDAQHYEKQKQDGAVSYQLSHEHVLSALHQDIPVRLHAHRADDILSALSLKNEFNLNMVIEHATDGVRVAPFLANEGVACAVGPAFVNRAKVEMENVSFQTPAKLVEAQIPVAIITDHPVTPIQFLPLCVGLAMREGLSDDKALAAVTTVPAKILNLSGQLGRIEKGYEADLVIWQGEPFTITGTPAKVFIKGECLYQK